MQDKLEEKDQICDELRLRLKKRDEINKQFNQDNENIRKKINLNKGKEDKLISEANSLRLLNQELKEETESLSNKLQQLDLELLEIQQSYDQLLKETNLKISENNDLIDNQKSLEVYGEQLRSKAQRESIKVKELEILNEQLRLEKELLINEKRLAEKKLAEVETVLDDISNKVPRKKEVRQRGMNLDH